MNASVDVFLARHAPALAAAALARIEASEAQYGDSHLWASRRHLVQRLAEQTIDVGAYAALLAARPDTTQARELLAAIAQRAAEADALIDELRRVLDREAT